MLSRFSLSLAILAAAHCSPLSAQDAEAIRGGDPRSVADDAWIVFDTTASRGVRSLAEREFLDLGGFRFVWLRVSRPMEPGHTFLFHARMIFDCRRRLESVIRMVGVDQGRIVSDQPGMSPLWETGPREPAQRRLIAHVCGLPAQAG